MAEHVKSMRFEDIISFIKNLFIKLVVFCFVINVCAEDIENIPGMLALKVKESGTEGLFRYLQEYNLTQLFQITPSTYIFEYRGTKNVSDVLPLILKEGSRYKDEIDAVEPIKEYKHTFRYEDVPEDEKTYTLELTWSAANVEYENNYGMGVPEAWSMGYSGRGVTIAITDVGVNTDLEDLKHNIDMVLSKNFVDRNKNVTPEFFHNFKDKTSVFTDHGNKVASIIAAARENNLCSAGIAYSAKVVVLKIYRVLVIYNQVALEPSHWSRSDIISRALSYKPNDIDIFCNAWASTEAFDTLDLATREAIKHGAESGRRGLGTVYVVPSGPPGNELSNNIYTLTVNSIGINGTIPNYTNADASVITCGLGDGTNLTSSFMVTTTLDNACVTSFNGVSAATSQIAAIIALAIEANKNLSQRDILHLLVHASSNKGLKEETAFKRNAAGKLYHDFFGFGLIDAGKLVKLAEKQQPLKGLLSKNLTSYIKRPPQSNQQTYEFCNDFTRMIPGHTLNTVEQVLVNINFTSTADKIRILLKSPSETTSLLIDYSSKQRRVAEDNLKLVSVHFWGELPYGPWSLIVSDNQYTKLRSASLILYGTNDETLSSYQDMKADACEKYETETNDVDISSSKNVTESSSGNSEKNIVCGEDAENVHKMFALKVKENETERVFRNLQEYNLTGMFQITPSTYIFEYRGPENLFDKLPSILRGDRFRDQIVEIEPVKEYKLTFGYDNSPAHAIRTAQTSSISSSNLVCDHYYGMGVPDAWSLGYTGSGVSVAVTDVGVNTELEDLKDNIDIMLSKSFVVDNGTVTPEVLQDYPDKTIFLTDHGNKVASIIAAVKGNNLCSAGIAFKANIIVLKIFNVSVIDHIPTLEQSSRSDVISRALCYMPDEIDVFANAWSSTHAFDKLDVAIREAIEYCAENGRSGLGSIYVVPSGPPGNELSNNIYTITVNGIGRYGTIPEYTNVDASVITCGLGDGNNLTSSSMVTTTLNNACLMSFKGVSAATAQIAGIIALAIEANKNLSRRDILHLLVRASGNKGLAEENAFKRNAAGNFFHDVLGFGLIDAGKLVKLAVKQQPVPRLLSKTLTGYIKRSKEGDQHTYEFCNDFTKMKQDRTFNTVEQVLLNMNFTSTFRKIRIFLKSPSGTTSLLMNYTSEQDLEVKDNLKLVSVHFWGESPFGPWSLIIRDHFITDLRHVSLTLYGTNNDTVSSDQYINADVCDNPEDVDISTSKDETAATSKDETAATSKDETAASLANSKTKVIKANVAVLNVIIPTLLVLRIL